MPSESIAVSCLVTAVLALRLQPGVRDLGHARRRRPGWRCSASALGPVGAAFLLWDIGMKKGNVPLLGVLSYASPIISTGLLVRSAWPRLASRHRLLRADGRCTVIAACLLMR